ncbi:LisH [Dictyocaulus viviparus]|uniref:LisH n=1 Tax=Dictyocaulus viviparus TaxID=29172 RepID=A0A0D8YC47_DICVI|nr:LisH [Dictyocaulus viviparus]
MVEKNESLTEVELALNHLSDELDKFDATWDANMSKVLSSVDLYDRELLSDCTESEMSVTAQMLLEEVASRGEEILTQMLAHHKSLHHAVSQVGKDIDKTTLKNIGGLIRNEKDIERDSKAERLVNGMVCDYLMTCGLTSVAELLVKEAGLSGRIDGYLANRKVIDWIMESLKNQDIAPAIAWLKQNPHSDSKLQYDLLQQHMIALIQDGKRIEALQFGRQLSSFGYEQDTAHVMGAVVLAKDCTDPRYEALFSPLAWPLLESRMSIALAQSDTRFGNVILTGMRAVPILMNLKQVMVSRQDHLFSGEELPVEVKIDEYIHSTFTCPILRQQSTDNNPPMRLTCGHVISREAVNKLCSNHRNNRLKCPYCPEESHQNDAKQVYF